MRSDASESKSEPPERTTGFDGLSGSSTLGRKASPRPLCNATVDDVRPDLSLLPLDAQNEAVARKARLSRGPRGAP